MYRQLQAHSVSDPQGSVLAVGTLLQHKSISWPQQQQLNCGVSSTLSRVTMKTCMGNYNAIQELLCRIMSMVGAPFCL